VVGEDAACDVPTIFTPNEDGVNDEFVVPCLATDKFPDNVVSIFNQWGDQVYRSKPYANNWKGTYDGQDLPVGTYFYVIEFGNGESVQSGFLVLER
jgi:gliding motility-associated-like protein